MSTVCILGLGYIGLPTAALAAVSGLEVFGVDVKMELVEALKTGEVAIDEPDLALLIEDALKSGAFIPRHTIREADIFMIAVPTPVTADRKADLAYVESAAKAIAPHLKRGNLVIVESTIPPLATQEVVAPILEEHGLRAGADFMLAYCPERVIPGSILDELVNNDRVVGGIDPASATAAADFYRYFVKGDVFETDVRTAEIVKLIENSYRDVNLALSNELSLFADTVGVDMRKAIALANRHPRVNFLRPGPGVGGHCIPVDPWFLVEACPEFSTIISASRSMNDRMPYEVVDRILKLARSESKGTRDGKPVVAVFGLTYKENVSDVRESPAMKIVELLEEAEIDVKAYDPFVSDEKEAPVSLSSMLVDADLLVILVGHAAFKELDPFTASSLMRNRKVFDAIGFLDVEKWVEAGFSVEVLGGGKAVAFQLVEASDEAA